MTANISVLQILLHASVPVQAIMLLLLIASVASWVMIFSKQGILASALKSALQFENRFWSGGTLSDLYEGLRHGREQDVGVASIFRSGYEEFARQQQGGRTNP